MGKVKRALEKYISVSAEKYIRLNFEERDDIILSMSQERFPHLVGVQYINKYKTIPSAEIIRKIEADTLSDKLVKGLSDKSKHLINNKTKAIISDMDFINSEFIFSHKDAEIVMGLVRGNLLMLSDNKSNTKKYAFMFKRGQGGIYHPNSCLLLKVKENSLKDIEEYKKYRPTELIHSKTAKLKIPKK